MGKPIGLPLVRDLLQVAKELVDREPDPPRQAPLRRAVSSAYYALFHAISYICADTLVGDTRPWPLFEPMYRSLDHLDVKNRLLADGGRAIGAGVAEVGSIFSNLQDMRHVADYDPKPFERSREEVARLLEDAGRAIDLLESSERRERLALAIGLYFKARRSEPSAGPRNAKKR